MCKFLLSSKWALLVFGIVFFSFAELKIGFIDSDRILKDYEGTKEAEAMLQKEYAKWEQQATERQKKMLEMKDQLDKQSLLLSAERKREIESEMEAAKIEYNKFLQEKFGQEGEYAKKYQELIKPIMEKVNKILDKLAKNENYDFIFDARSGLVYAKKAYDVSEKVLQALKSEK